MMKSMMNKPKNKRTILVIEDERPLVQIIQAKLEKAGFEVAGALTFLEIAGLKGGEILAQKGISNQTVLVA